MINKITNSINKIEDCASYLFSDSMNLTSIVRPPENSGHNGACLVALLGGEVKAGWLALSPTFYTNLH